MIVSWYILSGNSKEWGILWLLFKYTWSQVNFTIHREFFIVFIPGELSMVYLKHSGSINLIIFVTGSSSNKYKINIVRTKLKQGEKAVLVIRPHWILLFWPVLFTVIAIIAGVLIGGYGYIIPFIFAVIPAIK
jgi:hypothetical protein